MIKTIKYLAAMCTPEERGQLSRYFSAIRNAPTPRRLSIDNLLVDTPHMDDQAKIAQGLINTTLGAITRQHSVGINDPVEYALATGEPIVLPPSQDPPPGAVPAGLVLLSPMRSTGNTKLLSSHIRNQAANLQEAAKGKEAKSIFELSQKMSDLAEILDDHHAFVTGALRNLRQDSSDHSPKQGDPSLEAEDSDMNDDPYFGFDVSGPNQLDGGRGSLSTDDSFFLALGVGDIKPGSQYWMTPYSQLPPAQKKEVDQEIKGTVGRGNTWAIDAVKDALIRYDLAPSAIPSIRQAILWSNGTRELIDALLTDEKIIMGARPLLEGYLPPGIPIKSGFYGSLVLFIGEQIMGHPSQNLLPFLSMPIFPKSGSKIDASNVSNVNDAIFLEWLDTKVKGASATRTRTSFKRPSLAPASPAAQSQPPSDDPLTIGDESVVVPGQIGDNLGEPRPVMGSGARLANAAFDAGYDGSEPISFPENYDPLSPDNWYSLQILPNGIGGGAPDDDPPTRVSFKQRLAKPGIPITPSSVESASSPPGAGLDAGSSQGADDLFSSDSSLSDASNQARSSMKPPAYELPVTSQMNDHLSTMTTKMDKKIQELIDELQSMMPDPRDLAALERMAVKLQIIKNVLSAPDEVVSLMANSPISYRNVKSFYLSLVPYMGPSASTHVANFADSTFRGARRMFQNMMGDPSYDDGYESVFHGGPEVTEWVGDKIAGALRGLFNLTGETIDALVPGEMGPKTQNVVTGSVLGLLGGLALMPSLTKLAILMGLRPKVITTGPDGQPREVDAALLDPRPDVVAVSVPRDINATWYAMGEHYQKNAKYLDFLYPINGSSYPSQAPSYGEPTEEGAQSERVMYLPAVVWDDDGNPVSMLSGAPKSGVWRDVAGSVVSNPLQSSAAADSTLYNVLRDVAIARSLFPSPVTPSSPHPSVGSLNPSLAPTPAVAGLPGIIGGITAGGGQAASAGDEKQGGWFKNLLGKVAPVALGALGSVIAPGVGTAIGTAAGSALGNALSGDITEDDVIDAELELLSDGTVATELPLFSSSGFDPYGSGFPAAAAGIPMVAFLKRIGVKKLFSKATWAAIKSSGFWKGLVDIMGSIKTKSGEFVRWLGKALFAPDKVTGRIPFFGRMIGYIASGTVLVMLGNIFDTKHADAKPVSDINFSRSFMVLSRYFDPPTLARLRDAAQKAAIQGVGSLTVDESSSLVIPMVILASHVDELSPKEAAIIKTWASNREVRTWAAAIVIASDGYLKSLGYDSKEFMKQYFSANGYRVVDNAPSPSSAALIPSEVSPGSFRSQVQDFMGSAFAQTGLPLIGGGILGSLISSWMRGGQDSSTIPDPTSDPNYRGRSLVYLASGDVQDGGYVIASDPLSTAMLIANPATSRVTWRNVGSLQLLPNGQYAVR